MPPSFHRKAKSAFVRETRKNRALRKCQLLEKKCGLILWGMFGLGLIRFTNSFRTIDKRETTLSRWFFVYVVRKNVYFKVRVLYTFSDVGGTAHLLDREMLAYALDLKDFD